MNCIYLTDILQAPYSQKHAELVKDYEDKLDEFYVCMYVCISS